MLTPVAPFLRAPPRSHLEGAALLGHSHSDAGIVLGARQHLRFRRRRRSRGSCAARGGGRGGEGGCGRLQRESAVNSCRALVQAHASRSWAGRCASPGCSGCARIPQCRGGDRAASPPPPPHLPPRPCCIAGSGGSCSRCRAAVRRCWAGGSDQPWRWTGALTYRLDGHPAARVSANWRTLWPAGLPGVRRGGANPLPTRAWRWATALCMASPSDQKEGQPHHGACPFCVSHFLLLRLPCCARWSLDCLGEPSERL